MEDFILSIANPYVGVICNVNHVISSNPWEEALFTYSATTGDISNCYPCHNSKSIYVSYGSGIDIEKGTAELKAVVEACERYAASIIESSGVIVGDRAELTDFDFISLEHINYIIEKNGVFEPCFPLENTHAKWVKGYSVLDATEPLVPLSWIHLLESSATSCPYYENNSTGTAAHFDLNNAINSSILEIIERDHVELFWLLKVEFPKLVIDFCNEEFRSILNQDLLDGIQQDYVYCQLDLPLVVVIGVRRLSLPFREVTLLGASAETDIHKAILKARSECIAAQAALVKNDNQLDFSKFEGSNDVIECSGEVYISDLIASQKHTESPLELVSDFLKEKSEDLVVFDITTDDLKLLGLNVVRSIAPYFQKCNSNHPRVINQGRIDDVRAFLTRENIKHCEGFNPELTPFS